MIEEFKKLKPDEREQMMQATALVSLYAACMDGKIHEQENKSAVQLAHMRTYTSPPVLQEYYKEVESKFPEFYNQIKNKLPITKDDKISFLKNEIIKLNKIIPKLKRDFAIAFHQSLNSYAIHISESKRNFLTDFFIPVDIDGITNSSVVIP